LDTAIPAQGPGDSSEARLLGPNAALKDPRPRARCGGKQRVTTRA